LADLECGTMYVQQEICAHRFPLVQTFYLADLQTLSSDVDARVPKNKYNQFSEITGEDMSNNLTESGLGGK